VRAAPGTGFIADGKHEPIISKELFDRVQEQLARNATHVGLARPRAEAELASGLLRCHECGAPMVAVRRKSDIGRAGQYECSARRDGVGGCRATSYRIDLAQEALLAQIARLRGAPWTPEVDRCLLGQSGPQAQEAARVAQDLARAEAELGQHAAGLAVLTSSGLEPEALAAFKKRAHELSAQIRALRTRQTELDQRSSRVPSLRRIHAHLTARDLATHLQDMRAALGDPALATEARERLRARVL
jgi:hypothetical protein